jgi:Na+/melibiose symporter-like transporter
MILNPIISFKSDRLRSSWGRRIPFILFSAPPLVLSLIGLAFADKTLTADPVPVATGESCQPPSS